MSSPQVVQSASWRIRELSSNLSLCRLFCFFGPIANLKGHYFQPSLSDLKTFSVDVNVRQETCECLVM